MNISATSRRPAALVAAAVVLLLAAVAISLAGNRPDTAGADLNLNQNFCKGSIAQGDAGSKDDPTQTSVKYRVACAMPVTGYALFLDGHPIQSLETEVFGTDPATKAVVATDAFSCNGTIPGYGINCVGTYGGHWSVLEGQFTIEGPLCAEPRVDPVLTVATATVDSKGKPVQALAGPFDLGRPRGCKPTAFSGKTKIPKQSEDAPVTQ